MKREEAQSRIAHLIDEIKKHDRLYYVEARPIIGDRDYDLLEKELVSLEKAYPELVRADSPTQRVSGEPISAFAAVRHDPPMQSLDKTHSKSELEDFDRFIRKEVSGFTYVVEPKVDGVSLSLRYENRLLARAATRGNALVGDAVTNHIRTIKSVPLSLPEDAPETLEVRGEVYMTRDGFVKLNERAEEEGLEPFANPRNACAGSLKQLDPKVVASRPLDIVIYNAGGIGCDGFNSHSEMVAAFKRWGFPIAPWFKSASTMSEVFDAIDELQRLRHSFRFEIDGAVIKIDERKFHDVLGATAHGPRWARAYKYAPERAETIVEAITVQVGRTGILTPVAELKPIELAGSVISRATLHNADQIARQDVRVLDHVYIVKAGDVIPAIESVITEKRTGEEKVFEMPSVCPVCGGEIVKNEGEVALRCANPACGAKLKRRIEHFASRNALDIKCLGEKVADTIVEMKLAEDILDLFTMNELMVIGYFGKNGEKLLDALDEAKKLPLHRWLFAIGIPGVGETIAKEIAAKHETFFDLVDSSVLKEDKRVVAKAIIDFFASDYGQKFVSTMKALDLNPKSEAKSEIKTSGPLVGMGCVITGTLSRPRGEYAKLIELAGGVIQSSVTSKTKYLIAGANVGESKTSKARALGTTVIGEAELMEMLK
ncbi:MAG: NAD-dependent DNA ligase LigA [Kiritimatiellae bacterium]|nr:NAD-dependent DNA ligase LigA [Kiritimatiellia bacterium]